jgi:hypothetical protein
MTKFTLFEQQAPGDSRFVPPDPPMGPALQRSVGDRLLIIDRPLLNKNGNQRGSFVLHGTLLRIFSNVPNLDALLSFQASNTITGKGVINTPRRDPLQCDPRWCEVRHCRWDRQVQESSRHSEKQSRKVHL